MEKNKSDNECLVKTIWQLKPKATKRKSTVESFWTKAVTSPLKTKKKKNEIDTSRWFISSTNEYETPVIIKDEESKCFCSLIHAFYIRTSNIQPRDSWSYFWTSLGLIVFVMLLRESQLKNSIFKSGAIYGANFHFLWCSICLSLFLV